MAKDKCDMERGEVDSPPTNYDPHRTFYLPESNDSPFFQREKIGRYRVVSVLGEGGFGRVYLAHDDDLDRSVAIKVPRRDRISRPEDIQAYLDEAKTLARLEHPGIIPVLDVGNTPDDLCFVVSKYVSGSDLAERLKQGALTHEETSRLMATIADALHFAHSRQFVHRDVKPANILIDESGNAFLADFGLAMKDEDYGKGTRFAGTPAYMSPEQARGEGHRVDGRSDIFSLGVVFYEVLTGKHPFRGNSQEELMDQIASAEPRPPRQLTDAIPKELERICLKALSKRAIDRYTTAKDMAEDCRAYLNAVVAMQTPLSLPTNSARKARLDSEVEAVHGPQVVEKRVTDSRPPKIVPKGLRSFDHHDADFFLELLPGPRDRDGLPDSIRFWKNRVEARDPDSTFEVGLIYGPSGCGKSSMVKAGLLPRLSSRVISIYVEATAGDTETRLLNALRRKCRSLDDTLSLKESLASFRLGETSDDGDKILIVIDQFEQWLHAKKEERYPDLLQALRQCDGTRVQCLILVRDDFWLSVSRFFSELEVDLVPGRNISLADLFDLNHAKRVLTAFGRAFARIPEDNANLSRDQKEFLSRTVTSLAQEGRVISVRLSLFAEMMKGREWIPSTLKEVGGTDGVGLSFLEETFSSETANPKHRLHQMAVREVLKALLPDSGVYIKGHMKTYSELIVASGYVSRQKDFDDLIQILDGEVRLITPTDPEGEQYINVSARPSNAGHRYYQLSHDYLVPSLITWLTNKQRETRRGRAELVLQDRFCLWKQKEDRLYLPNLLEALTIVSFIGFASLETEKKRMVGLALKKGMLDGLYYTLLGVIFFIVVYIGTVEFLFTLFPNSYLVILLIPALMVLPLPIYILWRLVRAFCMAASHVVHRSRSVTDEKRL